MTAELLLFTLELEKGLDKVSFEGTDKENMRADIRTFCEEIKTFERKKK